MLNVIKERNKISRFVHKLEILSEILGDLLLKAIIPSFVFKYFVIQATFTLFLPGQLKEIRSENFCRFW